MSAAPSNQPLILSSLARPRPVIAPAPAASAEGLFGSEVGAVPAWLFAPSALLLHVAVSWALPSAPRPLPPPDRPIAFTVIEEPEPVVEPEVVEPEPVEPEPVEPKPVEPKPVEPVPERPRPAAEPEPDPTPEPETTHPAEAPAPDQAIPPQATVASAEDGIDVDMAEGDGRGGVARGAPEPVARTPEPRPAMSALLLHRLLSAYRIRVRRAIGPIRIPRSVRRARLEGTVDIGITVSRNGRVSRVRVRGSSGHERLDEVILAGISRIQRLPPPPRQLDWDTRELSLDIQVRAN